MHPSQTCKRSSHLPLLYGAVVGTITDADVAAIPNAKVTLKDTPSNFSRTSLSGADGGFAFQSVPAGTYVISVVAPGFASWKIDNMIELHEGQYFVVHPVKLEVGTINTTVNAISIEELAEQQVTVEEHQRIVGLIPNFYVTYIPNAAPLTSKQKFKLAVVVSKDPATFVLTGITAGTQALGEQSLRLRPGLWWLCTTLCSELRRQLRLRPS